MSLEEETMPQGEETPTAAIQKLRRERGKKGRESASERQRRRLSEEQVTFLEARFGEEKRLELGWKARLAEEAGLDPRQVAVWFQNRRARHKSKQVAEAYNCLKSAHDAAVLEKCHLENEVLILQGKLLEAHEEIVKLSAGGGGSPSSSSLSWQPLMADMGATEGEAVELMDMLDLGFDLDKFLLELGYFCSI